MERPQDLRGSPPKLEENFSSRCAFGGFLSWMGVNWRDSPVVFVNTQLSSGRCRRMSEKALCPSSVDCRVEIALCLLNQVKQEM